MKKAISILIALAFTVGASFAADLNFNRSTGYTGGAGNIPYTNAYLFRESLTMTDSGNGATPFTFRVDKTSIFVRSGAQSGAQWTQGDILTLDTTASSTDTGFIRVRRFNGNTDTHMGTQPPRWLIGIGRNVCDTGNSCFITWQGTETGVLAARAWRAGEPLTYGGDGFNGLIPARDVDLWLGSDTGLQATFTTNIVALTNCPAGGRCSVFIRP